MLLVKQPQLSILVCRTCQGTGYQGIRTCKMCQRMSMGRMVRGKWLYFGEPLTRYHIALRKCRRILAAFELMGAVLFAVGSFVAFIFFTLQSGNSLDRVFDASFWMSPLNGSVAFFWIGCVFLCFAVYRVLRVEEAPEQTEYTGYGSKKDAETNTQGDMVDWPSIHKLAVKKKRNIARAYKPEVRTVLEEAYKKADAVHATEVTMSHLFFALLGSDKVASVFIRLGIPVKVLQAHIAKQFVGTEAVTHMPRLSLDVQQIMFYAYEYAYEAEQTMVHVTDVLLATIRQSQGLQELLYDLEIDEQKLANVIEWMRIRQRLADQRQAFRKAASLHNKHGIDKAMTAVATPYLNSLSQDLTLAAVYGRLTTCVAREKEMEELFRMVEGGRQSIVLVGEYGVGKMTLIEGLAQKMIQDAVPPRLQDKRLVQLSTSALLAGTTVQGAQERLIHVMNEVRKAKNIILFIHNIHDLMGGAAGGEGLDVSDTLAEFLSSGNVFVFATTTQNGYAHHINRTQLGSILSKIDVEEMNLNQTIQTLEAKVGSIEYTQNVFISYNAIEAAATFADNFLHDQSLPESAINLLTEAASYTKSTKGQNVLVSRDDVAAVITQKTGIPVASLTEDESSKLLRLEEEMHKRVIGQSEAVQVVANALRRARAAIRSTKRPIANFLFLGSTGTGKTELAKTIAEVYFGGEQRMIRIDMSEYQDAASIGRLLGQPGEQATGLLTEAVRTNPFSLVLLDEMEKANPKILDLFLQVFDDGRLTDSVGTVIDFTNTIIIATSNAGTSFLQEGIRNNVPIAEIREKLLREKLHEYFRPEFLNRFDGVVVFTPLQKNDVKQIAGILLKRVAKDMEERGIEFVVSEAGLQFLADVGYDPEFGARPMRRAIQEHVENVLAELVLSRKLERRDRVVFDGEAGMRVER